MGSLVDSIDALYAAFSKVPKPREIGGCQCCISKEEIGVLLSKPLRALTGTELSSYSESAFLTVGKEADYLYFLPRILEMECLGDSGWPDLEMIGRAIGETHPEGWPKDRKDALMGVLHAAIREAIGEADGSRIDQWICAIARMRLDPMPFLKQVEASPRALVSFYECNSQPLIQRRLGNAFWDSKTTEHEVVLAWFKSPAVSEMIMRSYGLAEDDHASPKDRRD
jgi:hypothetical protein